MVARTKKAKRDIEKVYSVKQFARKLRRLADCIEQGKSFRIQVAGERISIPSTAIITIEHERGAAEEEIEFQLTWPLRHKLTEVVGNGRNDTKLKEVKE